MHEDSYALGFVLREELAIVQLGFLKCRFDKPMLTSFHVRFHLGKLIVGGKESLCDWQVDLLAPQVVFIQRDLHDVQLAFKMLLTEFRASLTCSLVLP
jgi:hypothetical protein